jgi:predicted GIY-YIG superfamily endonuclease
MTMFPPVTLYVMKCKTPKTYYVGTTYRQKKKRYAEHFAGWGCKWTMRHGCSHVVANWSVPYGENASQVENEVWMHYARVYGPERVRGGDVTFVGPDDSLPDWILPTEFGGNRNVDWG